MNSDDLFERMFAAQHRVLVDMANVSAFEEWSPLEILAMRIFARTPHALGAIDISRALGCSLPHASRLSKKLKARGLVYERRWHQFRSLERTLAGEEWMRRELGNLTEESAQLFQLLGRVRRTACE